MSDSLTSDGYTQPHSYGDIPVLPTFLHLRRKRIHPYNIYYNEFNRVMLEVKHLIELAERTEGDVYRGTGLNTKDHILRVFRHIDKLTEDADLPPDEELEDGGMYMQQLVDVIVGVEVADRTAEDYIMSAPRSSTWTSQVPLAEDDSERERGWWSRIW
jgi:hypothetical protein